MLGAPYPFDHGTHVVNEVHAMTNRHDRPDGTFSEVVYYADGVCRTCRVSIQRVSSATPSGSASHTHSEDEIFHVLRGSLQFGRLTASAGQSIAIPSGARYAFRASDPWCFVNHRRRISNFIGAPRSEPVLETWSLFRERYAGDRAAEIAVSVDA